ncbi:MAG: Segregation and condensation protein A [Legionellaceae bacterium]
MQEDTLELKNSLALVNGQPYTQLPQDLYIPPDALEVFLETFEGPLDLLLYLIKRENLNILDIPVAEITQQYMTYIEFMKEMRFELAAEYLVMAAMLAEIKSRLLLPKSALSENEEENDPRAELIKRLLEYEQIKHAAIKLDELPQQGRDVFSVMIDTSNIEQIKPLPIVHLNELVFALQEIIQRAKMSAHHQIQRELLSIRERMSDILTKLTHDKFVNFSSLFPVTEGRLGVVVTFIALLELIKQSLIEIIQTEPYSTIQVRARIS